MKFNQPTEPTLVELVEELEKLTPDADQLKYKALLKSYNEGLRLDKTMYRSELVRYIEIYKKQAYSEK